MLSVLITILTFLPDQFITGFGSAVYKGNLALWSYNSSGKGWASVSPSQVGRCVLAVDCFSTVGDFKPELVIREDSERGKELERFQINSSKLSYVSDTLVFKESLFFCYEVPEQYAGRKDANIYISEVRLSLFEDSIKPTGVGKRVKFSWDANSEADLSYYKIYYGKASRVYDKSLVVELSLVPSVVIEFDTGSYFASVTAVDTAGNESDFSNEVFFVVSDSISCVFCDLNCDGKADNVDWFMMKRLQGTTNKSKDYDKRFDLVRPEEGKIDGSDKALYSRRCR
jgi:hypothetical protein